MAEGPSFVPWEALFKAARAARDRAYAPYSHFPVGAAVLSDSGEIFPGCNVENASYGLSVCAERHAIGRMVQSGSQKAVAVAIVVDTPQPTPPCGMCRQVLTEFAGVELQVRSRNLEGVEEQRTLGELLPHAFTKAFL